MSDISSAPLRGDDGFIAWFAKNGVAANLLLLLIVIAGFTSYSSKVRKEVFPEFSVDMITVTVPYLGAAPEEVEEAVCARIEERVADLETVERVRSTAAEGVGTVTIELLDGVDTREALDDVKTRVDAIDTFPAETEKPVIQEAIIRRQVLSIAISGDADERTLRRLGEQVRDEVSALPDITQVELVAARPYEISIEVSEENLRRHGLSFDQVARAVRRSSLDLPGGSVKTEGGEILLRTDGQAYRGREFEDLVLRSRPDGTRLTLGQVATVVDGFADTDLAARFDGQQAVLVQVYRVGDQDVTVVAESAKAYVEAALPRMPEGVGMTIWQDDTRLLKSRLDTLLKNGRAGLLLVLLVLTLFLRLRLAFWASVGILVSFMGAFWLMPPLDLSVNMISLFAFIVVLGIVVDDAIVVGENIYRHLQMGKAGLEAAIDGVREVAVPVTFSILTTVAAFGPLLLIGGTTAKIMRNIPLIVISVLLFSLVEALLILPAHLKHLDTRPRPLVPLLAFTERLQRPTVRLLEWLIERTYRPMLNLALEWRYTTVAIALSILLLTVGLVAGGRIKFSFFPPVEADNLVAYLTLPQGTSVDKTTAILRSIEDSARELERRLEDEGEPGAFRHMLTTIGDQPFRGRQSRFNFRSAVASSHLGEINIELAPAEERTITASEMNKRWREITGPVPDAVELVFVSSLFSTGDAIDIQLAGPDLDQLRQAAEELKQEIAQYPGVEDITDSFRAGKQEVKLEVTPQAESLGISLSDLARQVRQAFYGEEAQRIQRGREEVKVMVRYPESERRSLANLEQMRVRTASGDEVPFSVAGRMDLGRGYATIVRTDRNRTVNVTADVDLETANANEILAAVQRDVLPRLMADYRGLTYTLEGEQQQQRETMGGLLESFGLAIMLIYGLLAVPFRSYVQPMIVMSAIPFGLIGAVVGHMVMGIDLAILSVFGMVALTGVVVNDSLVLVDFINRSYRGGTPLHQAIREAGEIRFRPILLTSLTTFAGLTPLLLERSLQAQFLIPMAISLAFGILFATGIILIIVPVGYHILEDVKAFTRRIFGLTEPAAPAPTVPQEA
ncbi:MAG: efflux RND transporter permease subunit [bacterium]|nr:efflux RND transporter permease subunit [bacterium]